MNNEFFSLFKKDLIFIEQAISKEEILTKIGQKLIAKNLVKQEFVREIINREKKYPTGLDLNAADKNAPFNIAIPHTERKYCNCKNIVVVKLKNEVIFNNMISPSEQVKVKYLFMILNNEADAQANILANIVDFINKPGTLHKLNQFQDAEEIYNCIAG